MATRIELRRDTAANWTAANPVLLNGEPGAETDTGRRKFGDGATAWSSLPYDGALLAADPALEAAYAPATELSGFTPTALPHWQRAKARVRAGVADAKLLCVGDSTTAGVGVDTSTTEGLPGSYPYQLASLLNSAGLVAARGLGVAVAADGTDPRWVLGSGWARPTSLGWGAKADVQAPLGVTTTSTYTDPVLADRYDIYYLTNNNLGTFTAQATGGSAVAVPTAADPSVGVITVSAGSAATTNVLTITPSGSAEIHLVGVEPWLSTAHRVRVGNAGVGGATTAQWAADGGFPLNAWNSQACIKAYAPDLTIISLGLNDALNASPTADYLAELNTVIAAAQVSGDVILVPPVPPTSAANSNVVAYVPGYTTAVRGRGLPVADLPLRWTSGDAANGLGYFWDTEHPNAVGYADIAQMIARGLLAT